MAGKWNSYFIFFNWVFQNERIILKADSFLLGYAGLNQELQM